MKLLGIDMPPSARVAWVSTEAMEYWAPRVRQASQAYWELELLTVQEGVRDCTTRHVNPESMKEEIQELARRGMMFLPLQKVGEYEGFAHRHPPVVEGRRWSWYGVVAADPKKAYEFADATARGDHDKMGDLLGYPRCCREFFTSVWMSGYVDPVWQEAERLASAKREDGNGEHVIWISDSSIDTLINPMLRYVGLRISPHIACSMDCKPTLEVAKKWMEVRPNLPGLADLCDLLRMSMEWNCLKGIAWISTPIFRIVTNSVPCWPRYVVRLRGSFRPKYAARGLRFPWNEEDV